MKYITAFFLFVFTFANAFALGVNLDEAKTIKSEKIEYNVKTEEIKTSGKTEMTNASGQRVESNSVTLSKNASDVYAQDIELWLGYHVYIRAKEITRDGQETIAKHAIFTACDGCDSFGNAWEISSHTVIHDADEKMLYFHNASFWLYDGIFPVLWLPYYEMPDPSVKYKSGLLSPSFNSTNRMGTQYNIPIYINFSERHDLTTTFSYLTQENPLFQAEHRLNLTRSEFRTKGSYTRNKAGENRWHVFNDDKMELGENARAFVYIARTSDPTYLQKYGFYNYQPYLDSGAKLELFGQTSYIVADTHSFQELRPSYGNQNSVSGNILPNIRGVYQTNPFWHETYLKLSGDVLAVSGTNASNQRVIGEASIVSPWTLWGGNRLTLSASSRYDVYNFDQTPIYDNGQLIDSYSGTKSRFLPSGYVEWSRPMYSTKNDWTYIIEPRARFTVMEHNDNKSVFAVNNDSAGRFLSDSTLFSDNRYAGLDVWENGNFIDYGARWAAFNKNNNIEVFVGQTYDFNTKNENFNDNGFRDGFSDYVSRISYARKYFQITGRYRFDRDTMALHHTENSIYIIKNGNYITIGHIWDTQPIDIYSTEKKNIHEIIAGSGLKLTKRVSVSESVVYNTYEHIIQRHSGGVYYEHPCFFLALTYQHDNAIAWEYVGNTTYQFRFGISVDGKHY